MPTDVRPIISEVSITDSSEIRTDYTRLSQELKWKERLSHRHNFTNREPILGYHCRMAVSCRNWAQYRAPVRASPVKNTKYAVQNATTEGENHLVTKPTGVIGCLVNSE